MATKQPYAESSYFRLRYLPAPTFPQNWGVRGRAWSLHRRRANVEVPHYYDRPLANRNAYIAAGSETPQTTGLDVRIPCFPCGDGKAGHGSETEWRNERADIVCRVKRSAVAEALDDQKTYQIVSGFNYTADGFPDSTIECHERCVMLLAQAEQVKICQLIRPLHSSPVEQARIT